MESTPLGRLSVELEQLTDLLFADPSDPVADRAGPYDADVLPGFGEQRQLTLDFVGRDAAVGQVDQIRWLES